MARRLEAILASLALLGPLLAACGSPSSPGTSLSPSASSPPTTSPVATTTAGPTPTTTVTVTRDVRYAAAAPDLTRWSEPLLDVYAPAGARGLPLVVMFPPHGLTRDDVGAFTQLASAVAKEGAVAVVVDWSQLEDPPAEFVDLAVLEEIVALGQSLAGCAVSYAVAHASDYGADASRLVLLGELYGGNVASKIALDGTGVFPGCESTSDWEATGLVGWDTDWLVTMPAWDALGSDAAGAVAALSPWPSLAGAPRIPVALVVTDAMRAASARCDDRDAAWMVARDPTGAMRARLDEVEAFADGCQDLGDSAAATATEMRARGIAADVIPLSDGTTRLGGGHVQSLGMGDLATLTETVLRIAGVAPAP